MATHSKIASRARKGCARCASPTTPPGGESVLLALGGYLATYTYNLKLAQRKDRLDRVNQQLSELYGPLLALASSSGACWTAFRQRYRPNGLSFWDSEPTPAPRRRQRGGHG
jgi:hypothetical protein